MLLMVGLYLAACQSYYEAPDHRSQISHITRKQETSIWHRLFQEQQKTYILKTDCSKFAEADEQINKAITPLLRQNNLFKTMSKPHYLIRVSCTAVRIPKTDTENVVKLPEAQGKIYGRTAEGVPFTGRVLWSYGHKKGQFFGQVQETTSIEGAIVLPQGIMSTQGEIQGIIAKGSSFKGHIHTKEEVLFPHTIQHEFTAFDERQARLTGEIHTAWQTFEDSTLPVLVPGIRFHVVFEEYSTKRVVFNSTLETVTQNLPTETLFKLLLKTIFTAFPGRPKLNDTINVYHQQFIQN